LKRLDIKHSTIDKGDLHPLQPKILWEERKSTWVKDISSDSTPHTTKRESLKGVVGELL